MCLEDIISITGRVFYVLLPLAMCRSPLPLAVGVAGKRLGQHITVMQLMETLIAFQINFQYIYGTTET